MIQKVHLRFGKAPALSPEAFDCTPITVFVGPNNSGKSKVLQELFRFSTTGQQSSTDVILDTLDFEPMAADIAERRIEAVTLRPRTTETLHPDHVIIGKRGVRNTVSRSQLLTVLTNPTSNLSAFCGWYLGFNTIMLDGKSRIGLVQPQTAGDLQESPQSSFQFLFRNDTQRSELRRMIHEAFGSYLVIDPTHLGQLRLRMSSSAPPSAIIERGIHEAAVAFHASAEPIDSASDGVKAFTGMMSEIVAGDPTILLIDEPEAFLHPALAFLLGKEISRAALGSQKRVFASTHSPNFVMGCVQSGVPVTLVRLTYKEGVATARILASSDILRLMRNPLLRSTNVLNGLFYEAVVITEADSDRAFYQEINERLLRRSLPSGMRNCLFINAQNKQTVPTIMRPLRELGIPAAGIVDIDVLKEGGNVWTSLVSGAFLPSLEQNATSTMRAGAKAQFDATGRDMKRDGGLALLNASDREAVENLFRRLSEYGLFVVPGGEVESWLKHLGVTGHGPTWLIPMFDCMGEDPSAPDYVHPADGDVWEFMATVKGWLSDPARHGIPV